MRALKPEWLPACRMKRIIVHWTAGAHKASSLDKAHYHFLVEADGNVVRGDHSVKHNARPRSASYAAHTLGCNTESIGVSACCMAGARQSPFSAGSHPMRQEQWQRLAEVCADLCEFYDIPVTSTTVLGHGEVQRLLSIKQRGKWDPMVLPWDAAKKPEQVGDLFRAEVKRALGDAPAEEPEVQPVVKVVINGKTYPGMLDDGSSFVPLRKVTDDLGWEIVETGEEKAKVKVSGKTHEIDFFNLNGTGYGECRDLAMIMGKEISWEPKLKRIVIA